MDTRVRAALVHGSVVQGTLTPLSDLDLIVIAEPGEREAIWRDRLRIGTDLLGAPPVVTDVLRQRTYRWQARTDDLAMLDFTIDEGSMAMWDSFEGPVAFLIDRADVEARFEQDFAARARPAAQDLLGDSDDAWGRFAKAAALLLHGRRQAARTALHDLIRDRIVVLLDRDPYHIDITADPDDRALISRLDRVHPSSSDDRELRRSLHAAAQWYAELLDDVAERAGADRPRSPIEPAVRAAVDELAP